MALWMVFCVLSSLGFVVNGERAEFCQDERFRVLCQREDEVLLIDEAHYGRIRLGKCVKQNLGNLIGCQKDALDFLDSRCGGRRSCNESVMDPELRRLSPCTSEVTWHLEVSYHCVSVVQSCKESKSPRSQILHLQPPKFITSHQGLCSYSIQALPGQQINFTIFNFERTYHYKDSKSSLQNNYLSLPSKSCFYVGYVREEMAEHTLAQNISICRGGPRMKAFYTSQSSHATLQFLSSTQEHQARFLVLFEATGCILPQIAGATFTRQGETLMVRCNSSGDVWYLNCPPSSHTYQGDIGNCSHAAATSWNADELFNPSGYFPFGILLVVAVGVALGIFLGGTLLLIASVFMKKKHCRHDGMEEPGEQLNDHAEECKTLGQSDYLVHYNHLTSSNLTLPIFHPHSHLVYEKHFVAPDYSSKTAFEERLPASEDAKRKGQDHRCPYYESAHII